MNEDDFLETVRRRHSPLRGSHSARASRSAPAVCRAVADAAGEREIAAATEQLPDPFGALIDRSSAAE